MAKTERSEQSSDALLDAWKAIDRGDVVAARRMALAIARAPPSPAAERDAQDLLRRTDVAWPVLLFGGLAALFMLGLILLTIVRNTHP